MSYLKKNTPQKTDCIFCQKVKSSDDIGDHMLIRGETCFVTLNLYPYNNGHLMVVPYQHTGKLETLPENTLAELMILTAQGIQVLQSAYNPQGFNIGINQGSAAGAGIAAHLHQHIVPRWSGDTNFLTVIGETRTIPQWVDDTYTLLKEHWLELFPKKD